MSKTFITDIDNAEHDKYGSLIPTETIEHLAVKTKKCSVCKKNSKFNVVAIEDPKGKNEVYGCENCGAKE